MPDNGIKFFARGGHKLADDLEDRIEGRLREQWDHPTGADVGRITRLTDGADRYVAHLLSVLPHRLEGLHVVIDAPTARPPRSPPGVPRGRSPGHPHRRGA